MAQNGQLDETNKAGSGGFTPRGWLVVGGLASAALLIRLANLDHSVIYDELYHVLAARSLVEDGDLFIAYGNRPYTRAALFTFLVAGFMKVGGSSLLVARLASVAVGVLWVLAVYAWTSRVAGRTAGITAGLMMSFAPGAIYLSQIARFYVLQGLLVWIGAGAAFLALTAESHGVRRWWAAVTSIVAFAAARNLVITTLIPLAAVGLWALGFAMWKHRRRLRALIADRRTGPFVVLGLAGLFVAFYLVAASRFEELWSVFRWTTRWTLQRQSDPRFYHRWFLDNYGALYAFLPIAAIVALARYRGAAVFCLTVFSFSVVAHSFSGFKVVRVFYYFMPFFFALWAMAVAALLPGLRSKATESIRSLFPSLRPGLAGVSGTAATALALLFAVAATDAWNTTLKLVTHTDENWPSTKPLYRGKPDWAGPAPILRELAAEAEVVLSSDALVAYYYLGRADAAVSVNQLYDDIEGDQQAPEFRTDRKVGWRVVSKPESIARIMECYDSGLLITDRWALDRPAGIPAGASDYIRERMETVPLDPKWKLKAFRWTQRTATTRECVPPPLERERLDSG